MSKPDIHDAAKSDQKVFHLMKVGAVVLMEEQSTHRKGGDLSAFAQLEYESLVFD